MSMKSQPYEMGLLGRAHTQALNVLSHSLRYAPKSDSLKTARSDVNKLEKMRPGLERLLNTAACLFIILMIRTGISKSLLDYEEQGQAVIKNYYARNLDSQTFEELFPTDSTQIG